MKKIIPVNDNIRSIDSLPWRNKKGYLMKNKTIRALVFAAFAAALFLVNYSISEIFYLDISKDEKRQARLIVKETETMEVYSDRQVGTADGDLAIHPDESVNVVPEDIITNAKYRPELTLWKGGFPAQITLKSGQLYTARVSSYGHFFMVDGITGFFQISEVDQDEWTKLLELP